MSLDNVADLEALAERTGRGIEFILAVPARRYGELAEAVIGLDAGAGLAEGRYGGHRLIVDYDAEAAARQSAARRERLAELIDFGEQLARKLDRQDEGVTERGRRASDRGAFARFHRRVLEAQMSRFLSVDFEADRFRYEENTAAIERAEALDGKLVLFSNVEDLPAAQIVERYRSLADIERGFRVLKSDIEIAPVYHRLPRAHPRARAALLPRAGAAPDHSLAAEGGWLAALPAACTRHPAPDPAPPGGRWRTPGRGHQPRPRRAAAALPRPPFGEARRGRVVAKTRGRA